MKKRTKKRTKKRIRLIKRYLELIFRISLTIAVFYGYIQLFITYLTKYMD